MVFFCCQCCFADVAGCTTEREERKEAVAGRERNSDYANGMKMRILLVICMLPQQVLVYEYWKLLRRPKTHIPDA